MIKYNRIMENIEVTPEMHERVLKGIFATSPRRKKQSFLKVAGTLAACLVLVVSGFVVWQNRFSPEIVTPPSPSIGDTSEPPVLGASDVKDYPSIKELANSLSFPLMVPETMPQGYTFESAANQFGMAVVVYTNGTNQIKYCMGTGTDALQGIFHSTEGKKIAPNHAILYSDGGAFTSAVWQDDTYSYSMISDIPLPEAEWVKMIKSNAEYS